MAKKGLIENLDKIVEDTLNSIRDELISEYESRGFKASGDSASTLTVNVKEARLEGSGPAWAAMEKGFAPGSWPNVGRILDWAAVKPVSPLPDQTPEQQSFLISRALFRSGDQVYQNRREGIPREDIIKRGIEKLNRAIQNAKIDVSALEGLT